MGKTINRQPCDKCGSTDNLITFIGDNGETYIKCVTPQCHSMVNIINTNLSTNQTNNLEFHDFTQSYRGISSNTLKFLQIEQGLYNNQEVISYTHTNLDNSIDIKYRWPVDKETGKKKFSWAAPQGKTTTLFALDKCTEFDKPLFITEGNEDAATLWELGFQACSLLSASGIDKQLIHSIDYINKFKEIVIATDIDHTTNNVRPYLLEIFKDKLVYTVDFSPYKDANEVFIANRELLLQQIAKKIEIVPDGIIFGNQLTNEMLWTNPPQAIPLPWKGLTDSLTGLEKGQLYALFGGSSIGKSSILRELIYYYRIHQPQLKIANIFLEENQQVTPLVYVSLHKNIPIGQLKRNKNLLSKEEQQEVFNTVLNTNNLMFINEKYQRDSENLIKTIRYLVNVKQYDIIILDHISYIIGRSKMGKGGERRDIDELLYELQDLCRNLNCIILFACHLSDPNSPPGWDEGRIPGLYNGRGSRVLAQVPDGIIAVSRNMKSEYECDCLQLHVLKNRWDGKIGLTDELTYISSTGRLWWNPNSNINNR